MLPFCGNGFTYWILNFDESLKRISAICYATKAAKKGDSNDSSQLKESSQFKDSNYFKLFQIISRFLIWFNESLTAWQPVYKDN